MRAGWTAAVFLVLAAPRATADPPASSEVSFAAVGDVMLTRGVARAIKRHKDSGYPFAKMRAVLKEHDLVFGNLEGPIIAGDEAKPRTLFFRADPGVETALKEAGFGILSLANNHVPDQGPEGVLATLAALKAVDIASVGAGEDDAQAEQATVIERNGVRISFLTCNDPWMVSKRYGAQPNHAGTNLMELGKLKRAVAAARAQADVVIVSIHFGTEYKRANSRQEKFAHAAVDAGADLVIGHHPHVLQEVERYKGKFIAYSLGNFVFDQTFSDGVQEGAILEAKLTKQGVTGLRFVPFRLKRVGQPALTEDPDDRYRIFDRLDYPMADDGSVAVEEEINPPGK